MGEGAGEVIVRGFEIKNVQWFDFKENPPEKNTPMLLFVSFGENDVVFLFAFMDEEGELVDADDVLSNFEEDEYVVTHWVPLPQTTLDFQTIDYMKNGMDHPQNYI